MDVNEKLAIIESILFAGGDPIEPEKLAQAAGVDESEAAELLEKLAEKYSGESSGIELLKLNGAYQLAAKKKYSQYIKNALEIKKNTALSSAALEVLTVVAYNQPVTKSFIEHVRGVDSSGTVNSLVEKKLLTEAGRLDLPGRPIAYRTTDAFLRAFQISSLEELPELPERKAQITIDEVMENQENNVNAPGSE
ncbi:SMC-Scp complex subunit ScpB [Ruminococcus sp. Marseille-P6503]|uniref:SMC-Scp complex subunit ScpB n=1 Tax=Ruminococcus sp. Marseille-P6503 TaxID=2364796 RepID=UPI000F529FFF|nr:SMC-Scp complex subunit ScpB [Ruminococcus sp. Marseille-P6503]